METKFINWDADWSNCFVMQPKKGRMKWCPTCQEDHDKACFFHLRGTWMGCMLSLSNRAKAMAKIKGGAGKGVK